MLFCVIEDGFAKCAVVHVFPARKAIGYSESSSGSKWPKARATRVWRSLSRCPSDNSSMRMRRSSM